MSDDDLSRKILAAVELRGMNLERVAITELAKAGFFPRPGFAYLDLEGDELGPVWREGDVYGSFLPKGSANFNNLVEVVIECKHSKHAWVFGIDRVASVNKQRPFIASSDDLRVKVWPLLDDAMHRVPREVFDHPYFAHAHRSRQFFVFRGPENGDKSKNAQSSDEVPIRGALLQAQKAVLHRLLWHEGSGRGGEGTPIRRFVFPIVVTTAPLFTVAFGENPEVQPVDRVLVEAAHPLRVHQRANMTPALQEMRKRWLWLVDVVTPNSLPAALRDILEWRHRFDAAIGDGLSDAAKDLWPQRQAERHP